MKTFVWVLVGTLFGAALGTYQNLNKHKRITQPYVILQTEEPIRRGDTLQVLDANADTICIGYIH